ncbi:MAG: ATP-dependent helicase [Thermoplasmata archaeon]|nr:ATP-dependent helicase [Thermoplasmata archaeon]
MIRRIKKPHTSEEVLGLFDPTVRAWFESRFEEVSPPQAYAIPHIHRGENVLVAAPTGSGKTLTAFLSILNELIVKAKAGELEDRIYCVYVSPLKALANDIERNLERPLAEMYALMASEGLRVTGRERDVQEIRVAVRTGDTSSYMRQKMVRRPPHILITTPETLALVLSTTKFIERLRGVRYLIVDEIHEISGSKRGVSLALSMERLDDQTSEDLVRIGLSATQSPMEVIGAFLAGYRDGEMRDMDLVEIGAQRSMDLAVLTPVKDVTALPYEIVNEKMYDTLKELVDSHRTTLIFTNTRSGTEAVVYKLKERGVEDVSAHHGSLSKETRLEVEERLKNGEMKAVVTSTSLELGIDIGYIDLVVQIGSPKSIAKGIQRVGRAGHALHRTSIGRIVAFEENDLVETMVLTRCAMEGTIDRTHILEGSLDVLAQTLIGMSLERRWKADDAYALVRRTYPYRELSREDFDSVLNFVAGRHSFGDSGIYGKVWYDPGEGVFASRRGTRMIYFMNIGTIPQEVSYRVFLEYGMPLGELSEKFVERLQTGAIFLLGGKTYELTAVRGNKVYVQDAHGRKPTIPSWSGEMLPRTYDLSVEVGRFRAKLSRMISKGTPDHEIEGYIMENYHTDLGSARSVISYFRQQLDMMESVPTDRNVIIEGYLDDVGRTNVLFHFPFGRRVNDALSRAYAFRFSQEYSENVKVSLTDDNFMLTLASEVPLEDVPGMLRSGDLEDVLRRAVRQSELFRQRFRHTGARAMMILRNFRGREISVRKQQIRSQSLLDALHRAENFPVISETYNEILHDVMDVGNAIGVLERMESGKVKVRVAGYSDTPSPFGHSVVLAGMSDIVLMEDRSALLRELHRRVLTRVLGEEEAMFREEQVDVHFRSKRPAVVERSDIPEVLRTFGAMNVFRDRGEHLAAFSEVPRERLLEWASELVDEGAIASVWVKGPLWCSAEEVPLYCAAYRSGEPPEGALDRLVEGRASEDDLRGLEEAYAVGRSFDGEGGAVFAPRIVPPWTAGDPVGRLVSRYLEFRGPSVLEEVAFGLRLEEALVDVTLEDLERRGVVRSGRFVASKDSPQYMLARDIISIERGGEEPVHGADAIADLGAAVMFREVGSVREYFGVYGFALGLRGVDMRVRDFDFREWLDLLATGEVLHGRFVGGQVSYVLASDAPVYVGAYRRTALTDGEMEILRTIEMNPGVTRAELVEMLGREREDVMEAIDRLDHGLYVRREPPMENYWNTINRYHPLDVGSIPDDPVKELVRRMLNVFGIAPVVGIRGFLRLPYEEVVAALEALEEEGAVSRVISAEHNVEMYAMREFLPMLGSAPARSGVRVLSLKDPYVFRNRYEVMSRFGDGWYSVIVDAGAIAGVVHMWPMSGAVDVRDIVVDVGRLPAVLDALEGTWAHYRNYYMEIVRVKAVNGIGVDGLAPDVHAAFAERGFVRTGGNLVKGAGTDRTFTDARILSYALRRQHIEESTRYETVAEAVDGMGGVRSDAEMALRLRGRPISIDAYARSTDLPRALLIPEYLTLTTYGDLPKFRAAKEEPLTPMMKHILLRVPDFGISRSRLRAKTNLAPEEFTRNLKSLYEGLHVVKDARGRYLRVMEPDMEPHDARRWVVRRIFERFGLMSAEQLSAYMKHRMPMIEVRRILRELEGEGVLVRGLLRERNEVVHWMLSGGLDGADGIDGPLASRKFVLTPKDQLHQFLLEDIRRTFGMSNCYVVLDGPRMLAAFKARESGRRIVIEETVGDWGAAERIVEEFAHRMGLDIIFAA